MGFKVDESFTYEAWKDSQESKKVTAGTSLTMNDFYKLLAAELQNQDMSNPMDNAQMMNQMTQMAMMDAINTLSQTTVTTYAVSMIGKEGTFADVDPLSGELKGAVTGTITSVDLSTNSFYLNGDMKKAYSMSQLMNVSEKGSVPGPGTDNSTEKPADKPESPEKPEKPEDKPSEAPGEGE